MISSVPSHDEELEVNNAYAKIGLTADRVWAQDREDPYVKLNRLLWVQNCKLIEACEGNNEKKWRSVRDVIPASRLAQYGDYEYNEEREKMYKASDETRGTWPDQREQSHPDDRALRDEPWMLREVEERFIGLSSPVHRFFSSPSKVRTSYRENIGTEARTKASEARDDFGKYSQPLLYTVLDRAELQLQARVCSKLVKDLWNSRTGRSCRWERTRGLDNARLFDEEESHRLRCSDEKKLESRNHYEQSPYSPQLDQTLIPRRQSLGDTSSAENRRSVLPALSAEVPEFFPKGPPPCSDKDRQAPIRFFPSSSERNYRDELFPYNRAHSAIPQNPGCVPVAVAHPATVNALMRGPHRWIHGIVPPIRMQVPGGCSAVHPPIYSAVQPICPTIIHRPVGLHEKMIAPGQTNPVPIPVYQRPAELYQEASQRRGKNNHGVDFNNLILLTKNAMKVRRNQSKNPRRASSFILESRQPNLKSERDVLQWLEKGYPKRAREFATVNSLVSELSSFASKCDCARGNSVASEARIIVDAEVTGTDDPEEVSIEDSDVPIAKKRLYRDVLANSVSTEFILETVLDRRYDELEQQAMEQYRTSEECLALRYQELERQALEQYKNGESSVSSSECVRAKSSSAMCVQKDRGEDGRRDEGESGEDGTRCSGFGNRSCGSPGKDISSERGVASERRITILRSDNKCPSVPSTAFRGPAGQTVNTRGTTIVTKSLTALNDEAFEGNSKNAIKGASGDKMEEPGRSSFDERHPMPVSPSKQSIPMRTDIATDKTVCSYYRKPTTIDGGLASGGGDEKVTFLRSPSAQVWFSSFWG